MSRAVLISIRPKWCELIASGKKNIELRKTRPSLKTPFKCYIYETQGKTNTPWMDEDGHMVFRGRGAVIGEFICDGIAEIKYEQYDAVDDAPDDGFWQWWDAPGDWPLQIDNGACLTYEEWQAYFGKKGGYAWHISALKIYDEPNALSEITGLRKTKFGYAPYKINRPPQNWCYVRCSDDGD